MIQRKQSIYLFLALVCVLILLFVPIFSLTAVRFGKIYEGTFGAQGIQGIDYNQAFPLYLIFASMAFLSVLCIAFYKNRKKQLMLCRINLIVHVLVVLALTTFYYVGKNKAIDQLKDNGFSQIELSVDMGYFLAVAAIPFIILAIRGIRSDEKLLQSIDRIR